MKLTLIPFKGLADYAKDGKRVLCMDFVEQFYPEIDTTLPITLEISPNIVKDYKEISVNLILAQWYDEDAGGWFYMYNHLCMLLQELLGEEESEHTIWINITQDNTHDTP